MKSFISLSAVVFFVVILSLHHFVEIQYLVALVTDTYKIRAVGIEGTDEFSLRCTALGLQKGERDLFGSIASYAYLNERSMEYSC